MKIIPESPHSQVTHVKCRYFTQVDSWLTTCKDLTKYCLHENISPLGTKGFGTHTKHQGGEEPKWTLPSIPRMANATNLKPSEVLGVSLKVSKNFK